MGKTETTGLGSAARAENGGVGFVIVPCEPGESLEWCDALLMGRHGEKRTRNNPLDEVAYLPHLI
jgi:hypothetical protein